MLHLPASISNDIQNLQIQPPQTETPLTHMSICTFEISTPCLLVRWDIPAAAALVGDQWKVVGCGDGGGECRILSDGR